MQPSTFAINIRARLALADCSPGVRVIGNDSQGHVDDPSGGGRHAVKAKFPGVVIGRLELPIVHEGDAVYHIAGFVNDDVDDVAGHVEDFQQGHSDDS